MTTSILSLQIGLPRDYAGKDGARDWTSGIHKLPVQGEVELTATGFVGDGQADRRVHGGVDKAVLAYAAAHYPGWRAELGVDDTQLPYGAFGENLTVEPLTEADVCVGDTWAVGAEVLLQVSQPRQPCWKLARHLGRPDVVMRVESTGRTGWYFRVLRTGRVRAGDTLRLIDRPCAQWPISRCSEIMSGRKAHPDEAAELAACELLSASWRKTLGAFVASGERSDASARTVGP